MPMQKNRYPPDWPQIARQVKEDAGWFCEDCFRDCSHPVDQTERMSVHHLDHDPSNNARENLIALCSGCHLRRDAAWHARNASHTRAVKLAGPTIPMFGE